MNITPTNSISFTGWTKTHSSYLTQSGRKYTLVTHFYTPTAGESKADINEALIAKNMELRTVWKIFKRGRKSLKNVIHVNSPSVPVHNPIPESARSFDPGPMRFRKRKNGLTVIL